MAKELTRRTWDPAWRPAPGQLPAGPVTLWLAVLSDDQRILGAAPMTAVPSWAWKDGRLCAAYGTVRVDMIADGRYQDGIVVAVAGRQYLPVFRISLGEPKRVRKGWDLTVKDGHISFIPEPECAIY